MVFVDFKEALYSLRRGIFMQILKAYRKPDSIVYIIYLPYVITKGKVKTPDAVILSGNKCCEYRLSRTLKCMFTN